MPRLVKRASSIGAADAPGDVLGDAQNRLNGN